MPSNAPRKPPTKRTESPSDDVESFLAALDHPFEREILAVREIILGADPVIGEGIKWNAPSFRTATFFATFHLREKDGVRVILHLGAKPRAGANARGAIHDPEALLQWLADDRASATFRGLDDLEAKRAAFSDIVRQWIALL
jgi:hypothetical protein